MWKCPSSIQSRDSNSWPLEHDSPPITTTPDLPPSLVECLITLPTLHDYKLFYGAVQWAILEPVLGSGKINDRIVFYRRSNPVCYVFMSTNYFVLKRWRRKREKKGPRRVNWQSTRASKEETYLKWLWSIWITFIVLWRATSSKKSTYVWKMTIDLQMGETNPGHKCSEANMEPQWQCQSTFYIILLKSTFSDCDCSSSTTSTEGWEM